MTIEKDSPSPIESRYSYSTDYIHDVTTQLMAENANRLPSAEEYRYVALEVSGDSAFADIGRHIECEVFNEEFGNDPGFMEREYGPYEEASTFFISIDQFNEQATGVLRVIHHSDKGLKSWHDAGAVFGADLEKAATLKGFDDLSKVWDVGTIAVLPEFRGKSGPVSILLERAMYISARQHQVHGLISIIDMPALQKMRHALHIPFKQLPGAKRGPYLGSKKSEAVYGYIPEFYPVMNHYRQSLSGKISNLALHNALDRLIIGKVGDTTTDDAILLADDYKNQNA